MEKGSLFCSFFKEEIFRIIWSGDVFRILCSKEVHVQYLVKKEGNLKWNLEAFKN